MNTVDLHVHSTCSDGTDTPAQLVKLAIQTGLTAFALTDHDTVNGIIKAKSAASGTDLEVISGVEISCIYHGKDIHMLGYFIDETHPGLLQMLSEYRINRTKRNQEIVSRLQNKGIDITLHQVENAFPGSVISRAHIGRYLYETGAVNSLEEAFRSYIGDKGSCFVPKKEIAPETAIHTITAAGGIPVLAHPILYRMCEQELDRFTAYMTSIGLKGIETIYSTYRPHEEAFVRSLAKKHSLIMTGGSDYHGNNKPHIRMGTGMGRLSVPYSVITELKHCCFGIIPD